MRIPLDNTVEVAQGWGTKRKENFTLKMIGSEIHQN